RRVRAQEPGRPDRDGRAQQFDAAPLPGQCVGAGRRRIGLHGHGRARRRCGAHDLTGWGLYFGADAAGGITMTLVSPGAPGLPGSPCGPGGPGTGTGTCTVVGGGAGAGSVAATTGGDGLLTTVLSRSQALRLRTPTSAVLH